MPHVDEVRASKSPFQLSKVLSFVNNIASSTVAKICKDTTSSWASLAKAISELVTQTNALFPKTTDHESVVKSASHNIPGELYLIPCAVTGTAPWIVRIEEVKAAMAVNVEAERKVAQLNEEMQGLVRTLKVKDQNIQESSVKIELMERRMETVKKQAEAVTELEGLLGKAQKQEKYYVEAMEQLQSEFDALDKENSKLKAASNAPEKRENDSVYKKITCLTCISSCWSSYGAIAKCPKRRGQPRNDTPPRTGLFSCMLIHIVYSTPSSSKVSGALFAS
jgi:dynactin 1